MKFQKINAFHHIDDDFSPFDNWASVKIVVDFTNRVVIASQYTKYDGGIVNDLSDDYGFNRYNHDRADTARAVKTLNPILVESNSRYIHGIAKAIDGKEMDDDYIQELIKEAKIDLVRKIRSDRGQQIYNLRYWCSRLLTSLDDIEEKDKKYVESLKKSIEKSSINLEEHKSNYPT